MAPLVDRVYYFTSLALFAIGFHTLVTNNNLIKKIMGLNIMDTAVFLFFVATGFVRGGRAPLVTGPGVYTNPLPPALILTGIVIAVSTTGFALALAIRIYHHAGTLNVDELTRRIRGG
ncbi:MAG: cation:proton antiporter subunit C [Bacillota bacterium]